MPARSRDIAQVVANAINAGTYSLTVEAVRSYVPVWDLPNLDREMQCGVIPAEVQMELVNRAQYRETHVVDIGFGRHVGTNREDIDRHLDLVEEVIDDLKRKPLTMSDGVCVVRAFGGEVRPLFSPTELNQSGLFLSIVRLSFRLVA